MLTSENVRVYVIFGYIRNFYRKIDLVARGHTANDVLPRFWVILQMVKCLHEHRLSAAVLWRTQYWP